MSGPLPRPWRHTLLRLLLAALVALLGACATVPAGTAAGASGASVAVDPWESLNRKIFAFNEAVDEALLKPVAEAYRNVVPEPVRQGVGNFFGNMRDVWSAANHLLQGKLQDGMEMGMRVMANTFFGLAGVLDPATEFGLTRRSEDFGQTMARWGVGAGPYLVLPLLGPSTLRDSMALPLDRWATSVTRFSDDINTYATTPLELVQVRSELLATTQLVSEVALDKYSFIRDGFLARRLDQIHDGSPPLPNYDDAADEPVKKK